MISKQSTHIDDLTQQIEKLKEINGQLEYQWDKKYTDMLNKNDIELTETSNDY